MALHRVSKNDTSRNSLGFEYQLGHNGKPCPKPQKPRTMVVIDRRIHTVAYRYCACCLVDPPDHVTQLLRNRWFPATTVDPETFATFEVLDFFRLGAVHANINAHNFIKVIEKQTDALRLTWVAVCLLYNSLLVRYTDEILRTARKLYGEWRSSTRLCCA